MPTWRQFVRPQDLVWLLLFTGLGFFSPDRSPLALTLLVGLGIAQVFERRLGAVTSVVVKLILCYLLIGYSGGVNSSFYPILLLPVISAATHFGLLGTAIVTLAACAEYLSFLLYLDWENAYLPMDQVNELALRELMLPVVAFLTNQLAESNRDEAKKAQAAADQLAEANRHLQEAEAAVRRADRLAALGQLTAGLAHELRNPLGTMKTSAEMLSRTVSSENAVAREMATYISEEVDRTNSLITRFLEFARPQPLRLESADVPGMLDAAIARFEREYTNTGASVFKNYAPDAPLARMDTEWMERVIINLLANAAQASATGSVITIKTRRTEGDQPRVEISVIDRGSGIQAKDLENVFNPFFTTKTNGVGLGLAICNKVVHEHGGEIAVESAVGEGSVFRIYLPVSQ